MKVKWTKISVEDLSHIFDYIEKEDRPEAARNTIKKIIDCVSQLERFPEIGRIGRVTGTKELIIPSTPFIIIYRIKNSVLEILTILHHSRMWS